MEMGVSDAPHGEAKGGEVELWRVDGCSLGVTRPLAEPFAVAGKLNQRRREARLELRAP